MKTKTQENSAIDLITNFQTNVGSIERIASAVGGGAMIALGVRQGGVLGSLIAVLGGGIALRGVTGHCQVYDALDFDTSDETANPKSPFHKGFLNQKIHVTKSVTVNKSPAELYEFWHNFENLPKFMTHLESVKVAGEKRSHWKAKAPLGAAVEWDAEITMDKENERIGWKSTEGSDVPNSGVVEFLPTSDRGTEVKVVLTYEPPAGQIGALFAKLFGEEPGQQISEDLRRFKSMMEAGEVIAIEGQSSGREAKAKKASA